ncbi:MAG TPA: mechanosensitive ion channel family protein [Polyangiaceae bacterium]|nr:mechanosensitive ion channel family protein [Polyangiaceae bacterium]
MVLQALLKAPPAVYGLAIGTLGVIVLALLLPSRERRFVRGPLVMFLLYGAARQAVDLFPPTDVVPKLLHFMAAFAWCAAFIRGLFVLFSSERITRYVRPWPKIVRDILQGVLYVGAGLVSLRAVGVEPGSLLTTSALLTAVVGLSLQETLGNLFAGLALQSQQTIAVGDWVRFADGPEGVGEIIEINWRATHFLTVARVQVVVPNGVLARSTVSNYSRPTKLAGVRTEVVLPYAVSPERVRALVLPAIHGVDGVMPEPHPFVLVSGFNDYGVAYSVRYCITEYGRRDLIESAVRQRLLYALKRAGVEIPYPFHQVDFVGPAAAKLAGLGASSAPADSDLAARLGKSEVFRGVDRAALARLGESAHVALYSPGETIIRQGDPGSELYVLERGEVELVVGNEQGMPVRVETLGPGAVFGEAAFLTGGRRVATIVALSECEVLGVPKSAFHDLLEKNQALSERLTQVLATRMDLLSQALHKAAETGLDEDRRSDMLFERIRQFFGQ